VTDAAILLGALTGVDERDPATRTSAGRHLTDYTTCLDADGLKGARIGIARDFFVDEIADDQLALMEAAIKVLKQAGAEVIDPISNASLKEVDENYDVLVYEFKPALNAYLSKLAPTVPVHSLEEVIEFNRAHFEKALKHDQTTLRLSESKSGTLTEPEYIRARTLDLEWSRTKGIDATMKEHQLDAIFFPSYYGCSVAAKAGYPSVTVPAGYTSEGLPVGVTFTGMAYSEQTLIKLAYAYEQLTKHRVAPTL
jgi:amidase